MAINNTDYLRFSAYSIKDLITRKLSEDTNFTDLVYEGSNLAILIDIFSYMAQCILYNLNNAAAESMFSDTQIYENMNRLVKFIGYNPNGITPATVNVTLDIDDDSKSKEYEIFKYSAIDTDLIDDNGKKIYYSTIDNSTTIKNEKEFTTLFYNGIWRIYPTTYISDGTEYQKFILNDLQSNTIENKFISNKAIHVYVEENGKPVQYKMVDQGLFTDNNINNGSRIYRSDERIFNLRLNENKQYEITFGNGFTGKIPDENSSIYIFYLDSNGPSGEIFPNDIKNKKLSHSANLFGISSDLYEKIFEGINTESYPYTDEAKWTNKQMSSSFKVEESVTDIRRNAPQWFRTGNRLITTADFEYFVKNRFIDNIIDVKCQNNWQYISTFYQWLYNLGLNGQYTKYKLRKSFGAYYVNQNRIQKNDLRYSDSADGNNVYLWIKMKNNSDLYTDQIDEELLNIKTMTLEVVFLKPLTLNFAICAADIDDAINYIIEDNLFDKNNESFLEITLDDNTLFSNNDIALQVKNEILTFFNENNFLLGQIINFLDLTNRLLNLASVNRIRTVYINNDTGIQRIINGLSFATWTSDIIDNGDDMAISTISRTLEVFLFPKLYRSSDLISKIKVIRKSISNVNKILY